MANNLPPMPASQALALAILLIEADLSDQMAAAPKDLRRLPPETKEVLQTLEALRVLRKKLKRSERATPKRKLFKQPARIEQLSF